MFKKIVLLSLFIIMLSFSKVQAVEVYNKDGKTFDLGFWTQAWGQFVEDGRDTDANGSQDGNITDFMIRRAYFSISGTVLPWLSCFSHIAADRIGQDGLDVPSYGLGSGLAVRDAWINAKLLDEIIMLQVGRMYVPLTRNYGTTSTKGLLTADLDWMQGGLRGSIFYPSKVGRDDSICLWGNVFDGFIQYRSMIGEGVEDNAKNPDDNPRFVNRVSISLFDKETKWFNKGTYLGEKQVLSIGFGADYQHLGGISKDYYAAYTADIFYDQPVGNGGALTIEASLTDIVNGPNRINFTRFAPGDDADIISMKAGFLVPGKIGPGQIQPFIHCEGILIEHRDDTAVFGLGCNYYLKGQANKISLDMTQVIQDTERRGFQDHFVMTLQIAIGI